MLFLVLSSKGARYAIPTSHVVEVLPVIDWRDLNGMPSGIIGLMNYHGKAIPVIDLSVLLGGPLTPMRMGTRVLILRLTDQADSRRVAMIAERVSGTTRWSETDFVSSAIETDATPYLGSVVPDGSGFVQRLEASEFLTIEAEDIIHA